MADNTFLGSFVTQYSRLVLPLKEALESESKFRELFLDLGWSIPTPPVSEAQTIVGNINSLINGLDNLPSSPSELDIIALLLDVSEIYVSIKSFASAVANTTGGIAPLQNEFIAEFPKDLFNYLICRYLQETSDIVFNSMLALDIINYSNINADTPRPAYSKIKIDYPKLGILITSPTDIIKSVIKWNSQDYDFRNVVGILMNYLSSIRIPAIYPQLLDTEDDNGIIKSIEYQDLFDLNYILGNSLHLFLLDILIGDEVKGLQATVSSFEGEDNNEKGILLELDVPEGTSLKQDITDDISLQLNTSDIIGTSFGIQLSPSEQKFSYLNGFSNNGKIELLIKKLFEEPVRLFGQPEGTRLEMRDQAISLFVKPGTPLEYGIGYDLSGLA